jgi:glycosyltransferase involved in cell wall biosynthesis
MRVLHIDSGNLYGGVETLLVTLARHRELCPAMEPAFGLCFQNRLASELYEAGSSVHKLGEVRARHPMMVRRARRRLRDLLRKRRFDAVICHMPWAQAVFGPAVRKAGLPLVFWMHGTATAKHWLEIWARFTPPDLAICGSDYVASSLHKLYRNAPREVFHLPVAPSGVVLTDAERVALRAELDTPADAKVILQASRLEAWKGHSAHLEALASLRDLPGWVAWFAGGAQTPAETRYLRDLKDRAIHLELADRIHFLGPRADVLRLMQAADIYCQPNTSAEPFGIAFVEALFEGLPVVTSAMGGANEIIDSRCGITLEPGDVRALAEALRELMLDDGKRARLAAAGPARAAELCDPQRQIRRLHAIIKSAFGERERVRFEARPAASSPD